MNKLLIAFVTAFFTAAVHAAPAVAPDDVVKGTTDKLQKLIAENHVKYKADLNGFYKVVDDTLVPHFDVKYIGQLVLARNWKTATEEQRTRFQIAFKNMLIRSYANAMLENYDSVKAEWKPVRMAPDATEVTVNSNVLRKNGPPIPIGFVMHIADNEWKIYDITVESISLVSNFRAQFAAEIKNAGLDDVIKRMESGEYSTRGKSSEGGK